MTNKFIIGKNVTKLEIKSKYCIWGEDDGGFSCATLPNNIVEWLNTFVGVEDKDWYFFQVKVIFDLYFNDPKDAAMFKLVWYEYIRC